MTNTLSDRWARYYHVVLGKKHFDIVKALDEEDAIRQVEKRFGEAKRWHGTLNYRAYLCKDTP